MDTAPLAAHEVADHLETIRSRIAKGQTMGVTLMTDHNGANGRAGTTYLTVRFYPSAGSNDLISATFELVQISSSEADIEQDRLDREGK